MASMIMKCTRCGKRHDINMFGTNRLGETYKTCVDCRERKKASLQRNKCPHNKSKKSCQLCNPNYDEFREKANAKAKEYREAGRNKCEHNITKQYCIECSPERFCEHNRHVNKPCPKCNPEISCHHGKVRGKCFLCDMETK